MKWRSAFLWLSALGVALILVLSFLAAEEVRKQQYGRHPAPADNTWRINLNAALGMTRFWYQEGFFKSGMIPRFHAPTIENPTSGPHYLSYPPLFILAPLGIAHVTGQEPNIHTLTRFSVFSQFAMAVLAAAFVFFAAQLAGTDRIAAFWLGGISGCLSILTPASLIFFPFGWWADMAVLPLFIAMALMEALRPGCARPKTFRALQAALALFGVFADWLFFLLLGALFLKDLTSRPRKIRWEFVAAPLLYCLYHAFIIWNSDGMADFVRKVLERTGISNQEMGLSEGVRSWIQIQADGLGPTGFWLYMGTVVTLPFLICAFFLRHRFSEKLRYWVELAFLVVLPMHLHSILLRQHYYHHTYNSVKFALLVPVVWFGLLPALANLAYPKRAMQVAAVLLSLFGALAYAREFPPIYNVYFEAPFNLDSNLERHCEVVLQHAKLEDIHFSPHFAIFDQLVDKQISPQELPISEWGEVACGRAVYLALKPSDFPFLFIRNYWNFRLHGIHYRLRLWTIGPPEKIWAPYIIPGSGEKLGHLEVHELQKAIFTQGI